MHTHKHILVLYYIRHIARNLPATLYVYAYITDHIICAVFDLICFTRERARHPYKIIGSCGNIITIARIRTAHNNMVKQLCPMSNVRHTLTSSRDARARALIVRKYIFHCIPAVCAVCEVVVLRAHMRACIVLVSPPESCAKHKRNAPMLGLCACVSVACVCLYEFEACAHAIFLSP